MQPTVDGIEEKSSDSHRAAGLDEPLLFPGGKNIVADSSSASSSSKKRCGFKLPPKLLLAIFCFVNLLNYLDRGLVAGVLPDLEKTFNIDSTAQGVLAGAFMGGYAVFSPILAHFSFSYPPFPIMSIGLACWVAAAILASFSPSYGWLVVARVLSGVGEAGFQNIAPPLIDDVAPPHLRGLWLSLFFCCIPVGQALGFVYGGALAHIWRWAFFFEGVVMAPIVVFGIFTTNELSSNSKTTSHKNGGKELIGHLISILKSPVWICNVLGYASFTFVVGAFAFWAPTYVKNVFDMDISTADLWVGGITVFAGLFGTAIGGALLDWSKKRFRQHHGIVLALGQMCVAACVGLPLCLVAFWFPAKGEQFFFFGVLAMGEFLLLMTTSATNAVFLWCVPKEIRPLSMAMSVVVMHGLGDVPSPTIVGAIQDRTNDWAMTMTMTSAYLIFCCLFWIAAFLFARKREFASLDEEDDTTSSLIDDNESKNC